ncbi:MAG TPA: Holliday junction resolvase-like protein [Actinomycetota bacterium]|nr:Holliday junction resolvase-like protein [Actinomycetota bacterium]
MEAVFGIVLLVIVFVLASALVREVRAHHQLKESIPEIERRAREHAVKTSDGVRLGQLAEQFVPFLPQFQYDPQDAHFLGKPIDFIVFDGLCDDGIDQIVFIEVKSGKKKTLGLRQRHIRDCVLEGRIKFEVVPVSEVASTYS